MAEDSVITPSGIEYLIKKKGKLKWTGELVQLQSFIKYALFLEAGYRLVAIAKRSKTQT